MPFDGDLDQLITKLDTELRRVIDSLAPTKEVTVLTHRRQPWYDETVKSQHKVVRDRERVWNKYKLESTWIAYKKERNIYNRLLKFKKRQVLSNRVNDLKGDTKALYKLTNNVTGSESSNPMPPNKSDAQLADELADFFLDKIGKI